MEERIEAVLSFWFADATKPHWFVPNPELDQDIRDHFGELYEKAQTNQLWVWKNTPDGLLALVILLDQFPRNMFRGSPAAYQSDEQALALTKFALDAHYDKELSDEKRMFLYMPLMHSESEEDQALSVQLFSQKGLENSYDFAKQHQEIITRFGRFPHRNNVLERISTPEEIVFLMGPNSHF